MYILSHSDAKILHLMASLKSEYECTLIILVAGVKQRCACDDACVVSLNIW